MAENGWTASEREALAGLPRERRPSDLLEERTVRGLREQGLLRRRGLGLTPAWTAAAAALVAAAVCTSFALGQWFGARQTASAMLAMHELDSARVAVEVQRTGSAYVTTLGVLARTADPVARNEGREVALSALYAAAEEMVRLDPDDPVARSILLAMEPALAGSADDDSWRRVLWF